MSLRPLVSHLFVIKELNLEEKGQGWNKLATCSVHLESRRLYIAALETKAVVVKIRNVNCIGVSLIIRC